MGYLQNAFLRTTEVAIRGNWKNTCFPHTTLIGIKTRRTYIIDPLDISECACTAWAMPTLAETLWSPEMLHWRENTIPSKCIAWSDQCCPGRLVKLCGKYDQSRTRTQCASDYMHFTRCDKAPWSKLLYDDMQRFLYYPEALNTVHPQAAWCVPFGSKIVLKVIILRWNKCKFINYVLAISLPNVWYQLN